MSYAKVKDGQIIQYPYGLSSLKRDFPNTSFPEKLDRLDLKSFGVMKVYLTPKPKESPDYRVVEDTPHMVEGRFFQKWKQIPLTELQKAQNLEQKAQELRQERNRRLSESDWTQLSDAKVSQQAWADYRQKLRDLTKQNSFPDSVIWPTEPTKESIQLSEREALKKMREQELSAIRHKKRGINL